MIDRGSIGNSARNIIDFAAARQRIAERTQTSGGSSHFAAVTSQQDGGKPEWGDNIMILAAYARLVKAEHAAESACIDFEQRRDGITDAWWDGPDDIRERVHEHNRKWDRYIGLLRHLAALPAETRREAQVKRSTIGRQWLAPDVSCAKLLGPLREGCLRDDHLFPPSMKLARR